MFAACGYGGIPVQHCSTAVRLNSIKSSKEAEEPKRSTEQIIEKLKAQGPKNDQKWHGRSRKRGSWCHGKRMAKCCQPCSW
ncbi:MAG: hypothetical protein ACLUPK_07565 [Veillonella sp.]